MQQTRVEVEFVYIHWFVLSTPIILTVSPTISFLLVLLIFPKSRAIIRCEKADDYEKSVKQFL